MSCGKGAVPGCPAVYCIRMSFSGRRSELQCERALPSIGWLTAGYMIVRGQDNPESQSTLFVDMVQEL